jgi:O-antigen ligase
MLKVLVEKKLAAYLSFGTFFVSVFLLASTNTDPVNVTKLFALGIVSGAVFGISIKFGSKILLANHKLPILVVAIFNFSMLSSLIFSNSPISQNFYGAYGRSNGFLTYSLFSFLLISGLLLSNTKSFDYFFYGLFAAGILNLAYCAWVLSFGDFIPWSNPYGNILGLLGNPDFISAFLGIFIAGAVAFVASPQTSLRLRLILVATILLAFFEILKSHAIQGVVVTTGGIGIVGFYFVRERFKHKLLTFGYGLFSCGLGLAAVFGALQKGPFSFVYKRSISLRGTYWRTGLEMGNSHPYTGIGIDSYGDWYRRARPPVAVIDMPGVNIVSNVSHNVVIDFYASGGWPLLLSYIAILLLGLSSIFRITRRIKTYDRIFVGLTSVWLCYEVQSFISINQIGLAIWGWVATGLLIAYDYSTRFEVTNLNPQSVPKKNRGKTQESVLSPDLVAGIGAMLGLIIALPPLAADATWFTAINSHDATKVENSLASSFFNPSSSYRYAQAVELFQNSKLPDLALKYAEKAVLFNPDYFDAWKELYSLPNATSSDRERALSNMKRLDPRNPDVTGN